MKRVAALLIALALIASMVGCPADPVHDPEPEPGPDPIVRHELSISATIGGSVTSPGEGTFEYDAGTVVFLNAVPDECYRFVNWTGDTVANPASAVTTVTMDAAKSITASFALAPYSLRAYSKVGGVVISPSEEESHYDCGTVVNLIAEAEDGYQFIHWTGTVGTISDVNAASTTVTMMGDYTITANFAKEIRNWYDLDAIRDNLGGTYVLMNDLDATTAGYAELAGPKANQGKGWQPIGRLYADPDLWDIVDPVGPFTGRFDGRGYEIRDVFVARPAEGGVGLFGFVGEGGVIQNTGVVNGEVSGRVYVGGVVGLNEGTLSESHFAGSVIADSRVGGLIGYNVGTLSNSRSSASVNGHWDVGGLVGWNHEGVVSNSHSGGSVIGGSCIGGLVGANWGTVSNSYYNYDEMLINGENTITIGALYGDDFQQWLANGKHLDIGGKLSQQDGYYVIGDSSDFVQLLAFGQDDSLRFRLKSDLDLTGNPGLYIPYLAGEFDGAGNTISNLTFDSAFVSQVGLFGHLASGGKVTKVRIENANIGGGDAVGSLIGWSSLGSIVTNSSSNGTVTGGRNIGGLIGMNWGTVTNSHSVCSVAGEGHIGGLVGLNHWGTVSNSYYNYDEVLINGEHVITIGALYGDDFQQWLANDRSLDINETLLQEDGCYVISNISDFRQLLAFGQDDSLRFRLKSDLDLTGNPGLYIPYLAGEFDGAGNTISNLTFDSAFVSQVGLFGYLASSGEVTRISVANIDITGDWDIGGVVGFNSWGIVSNSHSSGRVSGTYDVGGIVGENSGTIRDSHSSCHVRGYRRVGGLVGRNFWGAVSNCHAVGSVLGTHNIGGLVGWYENGSVSESFWDVETSGTDVSGGGTGKTTAQMKDIATFRMAGWSVAGVAGGETDRSRTWNIVDGQSYPFLSWQPVS